MMMARHRSVLAVSLLVRLLVGMWTSRTWFVPDEYWQVQEVAHRLVFNYGYLTWEWRVGIRGYVYPLVLAFCYKTLELVGLDNTDLIVYISPLVHSVLSAVGDYAFYVYVRRFYSTHIAHMAWLCRIVSWLSIYTGSRSLANNMEETLTLLCLSRMRREHGGHHSSFLLFHLFAFVSFCARATAAINLAPIYVYQLFVLIKSNPIRVKFTLQFVVVGLVVLGLNTLIDSYLHGHLVVTWYNFLVYNVYHNIGVHYGTHPWHWYLLSGYPTILFTHMALFALGLLKGPIKQLLVFPLSAICVNLFVYSLLAHKEFRFLMPTMPYAMVVCALGLEFIKRRYTNSIYNATIVLVAVSNLSLALFLGSMHQRAPISVMHALRRGGGSHPQHLDEHSTSVLFLTPCHSTPFYSFLHRNITMRFLTCEPPLSDAEPTTSSYMDEADQFYAKPHEWYAANRGNYLATVTHLVLFESLYQQLCAPDSTSRDFCRFLNDSFPKRQRFFHSFVEISQRTSGDLLLLYKTATE